MQTLNRYGLAILMAMLVLPGAANAESWICEHSNLVREINVVRETGNAVPCSVAYNKKSEGLGSSVLWTANADGSYCDAKADGLAEKLKGLGWACTAF